jgi:hypothetical protein
MKKTLVAAMLGAVLSGCRLSVSECSHQPGGPYYFTSDATYQEHRTTGEITRSEAEELANSGSAYYMAYFNSSGNPTKMFKVFAGSTNLYWQWEPRTNDLHNLRQ